MAGGDADRDAMLGNLAVQLGFSTRGAISAALGEDVEAEHKQPLGQTLVDRGVVTVAERDALEALVETYVKRLGNDPGALSIPEPVRRWLGRHERPFEPTTASRAELQTLDAAIRDVAPDSTEIAPEQDAGPGRVLNPVERFRILRPHARGGLGLVSVAFDMELRREVALKELQGRFVNDRKSRARFLLEAEITGRLEHPGIVPIYGRGEYDDGRPFYAMRLIRGESLKAALTRLHRTTGDGRADPGAWNREFRRLLRRFLDVCNTVDYAHSQGIIHRDLKPDNVMLGAHGEALVVDWGLAKILGNLTIETDFEIDSAFFEADDPSGDPDPTLIGRAVGTWQYMSPEQSGGRLDELGPRSDVYSLGATLYHLLTGQVPYRGVPRAEMASLIAAGACARPREVNEIVPAPLESICLKAMSPNAVDRHESARALGADLERWLDDEPIAAYRVAVAYHERRVAENPDRVKDREALGRIHSNLGNALHFLGRNAEAEQVHRTALAEFQALVDHSRGSPIFRERLAVAYSNLAWVLRALGRKDEADASYSASIAEYRELTHPAILSRSASNDPGLTALFVSQGWPMAPESTTGETPQGLDDRFEPHPVYLPGPVDDAGPDSKTVADTFLARFERGKSSHKAGARAQAIDDYTAAIRLDPTFPEVYNRRGNAYLDLGEIEKAIADYSRALRLDPGDAVLYYNRGKAFEAKRDHAQAIADFTEAIRLDPTFTKAHVRRSKAFNALGQ